MSLSYVNTARNFTYSFEPFFNGQHVLFLDLVAEEFGTSIFDRFRNIDPTLRNASCVIFRGRGDEFTRRLEAEDTLWTLLRDTKAVALVGGMAGGEIKLESNGRFRPPDFDIPLAVLRSCEITAILLRNGALFGPSQEEHYELPSGEHAEAFLRLGTALQDPIELTRITDWILPGLKKGMGVIGDTGTILPILVRLQLDAFKLLGFHLPIRVVDSYEANLASLQRTAHDLFREVETGPILFVVSVSSSGRVVKAALRQLVDIPHRVQIICETADAPTSEALVTLPIQRWQVTKNGKCKECSNRNLIHIDSRTYERVFARQRVPVTIGRKGASADRKFWEAVDKTDAVRVHHDLVQHDGTLRHYGIYLDIQRLLTDGWFRGIAIDQLRDLRAPSVALLPRHQASDAVRSLLTEAHPDLETHVIDPAQPEEELVERLGRLTEQDCLLIADDGLVSGTTLYNLRPQIQRLYKTSESCPCVRGFAVVARPSRRTAIQIIENRYRDAAGVQFHSAYQIYLPEQSQCPWCEERAFLQSVGSTTRGEGREYLEARIKRLSGSLDSPILWGGDSLDRRARSIGSFFGNLKQPAAFAAAASAILAQWHEATNFQPDLIAGATMIYHIDVPKIINNYFADAFAAAVFRTMNVRQLVYVGDREEVGIAIESVDPAQAFPCVVLELLWATLQGKLPRDCGASLLAKSKFKTAEFELFRQLFEVPTA